MMSATALRSTAPQPAPLVYAIGSERVAHDASVVLSGVICIQSVASLAAFIDLARCPMAGCIILDACASSLAELEATGAEIELPIIAVGDAALATAVRALKAGAIEYLTSPVEGQALAAATYDAIELSRAAIESRLTAQAVRARYALLSARERQVMTLIVSGLLNKQVGGELGISEITVKAHRGQVMRKMEARSFAELVRLAGSLAPAGDGSKNLQSHRRQTSRRILVA